MRSFCTSSVVAALFVVAVDAQCPNQCNGHGSCGAENVCTCDSSWNLVADCSQRECPKGVAFWSKASAANTAHAELECSNMGKCDRNKGTCSCYSGFSGVACHRVDCNANCNGHGYCKTIYALGKDLGADEVTSGVSNGGDGVGPLYANWDKDTFSGCVCDFGYFGPSCALRMCPKGDDPATTSQVSRAIVVTTSATSGTLAGTIGITFDGHTVDIAVDASTVSAASFQSSIASLANIDSATVSKADGYSSGNGAAYTVTINFPTYPEQNNIFYHDGNPPLTSFTCDISAVTGAVSPTCTISDSVNSNIKEYEFCSRRGICDTSTGICNCYTSYSGVACGTSASESTSTDTEDVLTLQGESSTYTGKVLNLRSTRAASTEFNILYAQANSVELAKLDGMGKLTLSGASGSGGLVVTAGGATITDGGLTVSDEGMFVQNTADAAVGATIGIAATGTYASDVLLLTTNKADAGDGYNFIKCQETEGSVTAFKVASSGKTTITAGGLVVLAGGGDIASGLTVSSGGFEVTSGTAKVTGQTDITGNTAITGTIIHTETSPTDSSGSTVGGIITAGGLGVKLNANVGGVLGVKGNTAITGTLGVEGDTAVTATTASTTSTTGAITTTGGLGVTLNANVGGDFGVKGNAGITGNIAITGTTMLGDTLQTVGNVGIGEAPDGTLGLVVNGGVRGSGTFDTSSDRRWKKNFKQLQGALAKVLNITGVSFSRFLTNLSEHFLILDASLSLVLR
jgi:hypothetical protein